MWTYSHVNRRVIRALALFLIDPFFLFYCLCWVIIRYFRISGNPIPYLNDWLTDIVFIPLIAHFSYCLGLFILRLERGFKYSLKQLFLLAFLTSIFFEVLSPMITDYNTADFMDAICYFLGACFFYYIHQPYLNKKIYKYKKQLF